MTHTPSSSRRDACTSITIASSSAIDAHRAPPPRSHAASLTHIASRMEARGGRNRSPPTTRDVQRASILSMHRELIARAPSATVDAIADRTRDASGSFIAPLAIVEVSAAPVMRAHRANGQRRSNRGRRCDC
ncbi:Hypothetical protein A7982_08255 [Minicystis rosea]|nr:Hypothetical protein A7982_08255 [Minicystis rosea]